MSTHSPIRHHQASKQTSKGRTMDVPETHFYRAELLRALEEMSFAVQSWEVREGARACVGLLEGGEVVVQCVNEGFLVSGV